jgi:hypothetical protein
VNGTHGSEQQSRRENQEHQIGQISNSFLANQFEPSRKKADQNQQNHREHRRQDGVIKIHDALIIRAS